MDNNRFFIIAKNITMVIFLVLTMASVMLSSLILQRMSIIAFGLGIVFASRVDSEENSQLNRKIGPWAGGLLSIIGICLIIFEISMNQ